jgi:hypothetical protein
MLFGVLLLICLSRSDSFRPQTRRFGEITVLYTQLIAKKFGVHWVQSVGEQVLYLSKYHRNLNINRKWTYLLADIHGMEHFCTKLAPPPYNKPRSCVSKIHTPMVWYGLVLTK